jgi:hypothetical protein
MVPMSKEKSQAAELRVALELDGKYALIAQANLKGGDIYCGTPSRPVKGKKREIVRSSLHAGGPTRLHRFGLTTLAGHFGMRPDEVKGAVLLSQGDPGGRLDWIYKVRADSSTRKTLVLQCDRRIAGITSISYWAIESGIADPVKAALELGRFPAMDVVGQVVSDWTVPQVMILVMVLPEASMASLEATIRADEEAKRPAKPRPE